MPRSRPKKKTAPRQVDPGLARKLEAFGRLAAFLEQHGGRPLDGVIAYIQQGMPMGIFHDEEVNCIRRGYTNAPKIGASSFSDRLVANGSATINNDGRLEQT